MPPFHSLSSLGDALDLGPDAFGWLRPSSDLLDDLDALRRRLDDEGYLYIPGYLNADLVAEAREILLRQLDQHGAVDRAHPLSAGIAKQPWQGGSWHRLVEGNAPLHALLRAGPMMEFYERLFNEPVRCLDYTWLRVIGPGRGTAPHADSVYMNRGSTRLLTSWTPLMDVTPDIGGLTIMPGSHRLENLRDYFDADVDTFCTNKPNRDPQDVHAWIGPVGDGKLTEHPAQLQKRLQLPWLTAEHYRPGDVVVFSIYTIHGSLDNHSDQIRLSTDTRYQPAADPADERWIGETPIGHDKAVRKGLIC